MMSWKFCMTTTLPINKLIKYKSCKGNTSKKSKIVLKNTDINLNKMRLNE